MSALFNQTNIAPGTPFSGGTSGNLSVNLIQGSTALTNVIDMNNDLSGVRIATGLQPITFSFGQMTDTRCQILPVGGVKLGFFNGAGGTNPGAYWAVGNNLASADWVINLNSVSSMNANVATGSLNMNALVSTLKVAYPGCIS
jgi:hypothetical protein